jgi:hypothetical protein
MISRLPSVRITPENVIAFCKKRGQKPTEDEAEVWLSRHRKTIEEILKSVIEKELDQILNEAASEEYPDPAFDRQWRLIDDAVMAASDDYAQKIGKEHYGSSHTEAELL